MEPELGSIQVLNPIGELERFFDYIFGQSEGYAYSPTKDPKTGEFKQHFFEWPTGKDKLVEHVLTSSQTLEVYYGPSLFREPTAKKEFFSRSQFVWAEFDRGLPEINGKLPAPHFRLQSSVAGREHWYWRLDNPTGHREGIEHVTQRLAYYLGADLSGWDVNQVLRPPGTMHHSSGNSTLILHWNERETVSLQQFDWLPDLPEKLLEENDINYVPVALEVIAKYKWDDTNFKFFIEPKIEKGHRSSALTKLSHICLEMGMTNAEALSILLNADNRWEKYTRRNDQKKWLVGIINHCRLKHPVGDSKQESRLRIYTFNEFIASEAKMEWVIPGLIHKKGILTLVGPPGVGKSQVSLRFAERMTKAEPFLKWQSTSNPLRIMYVSMEMAHEELRFFIDTMQMTGNKDFQQKFLIMPVGSSIRLNSRKAQVEFAAKVEEYQPDGIMLDSLGKGVGDDINSDKIIFGTFDFMDKLRDHFGIFTWLIHHPRKGQIGNKKPNKLDDLFGSQYIAANSSTVISLWPSGGAIDVTCLKLRMCEEFKPFKIRRKPGLDFEVVEGFKQLSADKPIFNGLGDLGDSI